MIEESQMLAPPQFVLKRTKILTLACLGFFAASCGDSGGDLPREERPRPTAEQDDGRGPSRPGQTLSLSERDLELRTLEFGRSAAINWPSRPLVNDFSANQSFEKVVAFQVATLEPLDLNFAALMTSHSCTSSGGVSPEPEIALYSMKEQRLRARLATVTTGLKFSLDKGVYAVTIALPLGIKCDRLRVGFEVTLSNPNPDGFSDDRGEPDPEPEPTPSPDPFSDFRFGQDYEIPSPESGGISIMALLAETGTIKLPTCQRVSGSSFSTLSEHSDPFSNGPVTILARLESLAAEAGVRILFSEKRPVDQMETLGSLSLLKQPSYPNNWIELLVENLFSKSRGSVLSLTDHPSCLQVTDQVRPQERTFLLASLNLIGAWPQQAVDGSVGSKRLPFVERRLSLGANVPDYSFRYAYGSRENPQWSAALTLDKGKILQEIALADNESLVDSVRWYVMDRTTKIPLSNWKLSELPDGPEPVLTLKADKDSATALLNNPHNRSIVIRFVAYQRDSDYRLESRRYIDFVLDYGLFCQSAYRRDDGALFHESLFEDLTNPSWNASPSREGKTGCAYAGRTFFGVRE